MSIRKSEFTEYEIGLESMEAGLEWMTKYCLLYTSDAADE